MAKRKRAAITWDAKKLASRVLDPTALKGRRAWKMTSEGGRPVLMSRFAEEPPPLAIACPLKGRHAVTVEVCNGVGGTARVPGTVCVECAGAPGPYVVPSTAGHSSFDLGVWKLNGSPLTIRKVNLGEVGISRILFEKRAEGSPYFSKASRRGGRIFWGICDQADFAVSSASSDIRNFEAMVRYHRELGFNTISWHMYLGSCEYPTEVGTTFTHINLNDQKTLRMLSESKRAAYVDWIWREFIHRYDCMEQGIRLAHQEGLRFFPCFRMNNEWGATWCEEFSTREFLRTFWQPEFFKKHPEYWSQYKNGAPTGGGMDYSHAPVRKYRLDVIREVVQGYPDIDGLFLDLHRHPPMVTYPNKTVKAFRKRYGVDVRKVKPVKEETMDPRWLKFRSRYFTTFMRSVKKLKAKLRKRYPTAVRTERTFLECLREGADLKAWFDEKLVDILILEDYRRTEPDVSLAPVIEAASRAGVKVIGGFPYLAHDRDWTEVAATAERWLSEGACGVAVYESNEAVCGPLLRKNMPQWVASLR